jgi:hypothetical protein
MSHDYLEIVLDDIYGLDRSITIADAYLGLLKPLSDKDRVEAVMSAGFPLDPIIESLINRIRLSRLAEKADPLYPEHESAHYLLPDKAKTASETALAALLSKKVNEMEQQLKIAGPVLDALEPSEFSSPPGAPTPSGTHKSGKSQPPVEQTTHPAGGNGGPEPAKPRQP